MTFHSQRCKDSYALHKFDYFLKICRARKLFLLERDTTDGLDPVIKLSNKETVWIARHVSLSPQGSNLFLHGITYLRRNKNNLNGKLESLSISFQVWYHGRTAWYNSSGALLMERSLSGGKKTTSRG